MLDEADDAKNLSSLLPESACAVGVEAADWRAAVRASGAALRDSGATTDAYTDEMIRTVEEFGPYMVIAPGVALAHSRPSPAVLRTGLSMVTLRDAVPFGHATNDPVSLVIGLAAHDESGHIGAIASIARLLSDPVAYAALLAATDVGDLRSVVLRSEEEGDR
jgi:ascorbate PTS system EIIA or EIIAB component